MIIAEHPGDIKALQASLRESDSFWIPMFSDAFRHYADTRLSFIYIYTMSDAQDWIVPFHHFDCVNQSNDLLQHLTSSKVIYALGRKRLMAYYPYRTVDADMVHWWQTGKPLPLDDSNTACHNAWGAWWSGTTNSYDWLPMTKHMERCRAMREVFMSSYETHRHSRAFQQYESQSIAAFHAIEQSGLQIDRSVFEQHFTTTRSSKTFSEYNLYTATGRPSNKHGGVNYAALNKENGCRSAFVSRHQRGMLLEMDFDAFHVRLIAKILGYDFPEGSVHEHLGKYYFGDDLTEEQYERSKQITFRLLYGNIDKEFRSIPFFAACHDYVQTLWREFKANGQVITPIFERPLHKDALPDDMNANKLFNYMLQATETEHNITVIHRIMDTLQGHDSKFILYTYDSMLFDYALTDGKELILKLKDVMSERGAFPVKIKAGADLHTMQDMTKRIN